MDPSLASTFDPEQWFSNNSKNPSQSLPYFILNFKKKTWNQGFSDFGNFQKTRLPI
jgi:hypothetical protein